MASERQDSAQSQDREGAENESYLESIGELISIGERAPQNSPAYDG